MLAHRACLVAGAQTEHRDEHGRVRDKISGADSLSSPVSRKTPPTKPLMKQERCWLPGVDGLGCDGAGRAGADVDHILSPGLPPGREDVLRNVVGQVAMGHGVLLVGVRSGRLGGGDTPGFPG